MLVVYFLLVERGGVEDCHAAHHVQDLIPYGDEGALDIVGANPIDPPLFAGDQLLPELLVRQHLLQEIGVPGDLLLFDVGSLLFDTFTIYQFYKLSLSVLVRYDIQLLYL